MAWRMPSETAPHERTWMAFPVASATAGATAGEQEACFAAWTSVALAIAEFEPVSMLVDPTEHDRAHRMLGADIELVETLVDEFWPGGLTVILRARSTLDWDLGETRGTVALRMPSERVTLELLAETGPLAVSSANKTGQPAANTAQEAEEQLGDAIAVYLDAGPSATAYDAEHARSGSTIVDATALEHPEGKLRIVRHGVIPDEEIIRVVGAERCA